ncbi:MAG TPA: hypothetical protein VMR74_01595 [Gammaproteobacteria bacterium]|nr:hypothetical protein [Gammaproteobacteria bacterium]
MQRFESGLEQVLAAFEGARLACLSFDVPGLACVVAFRASVRLVVDSTCRRCGNVRVRAVMLGQLSD